MKVQINEETKMASVILPPGTVIKINGIPLTLVSEATVETHKGNVPLITERMGSCGGAFHCTNPDSCDGDS